MIRIVRAMAVSVLVGGLVLSACTTQLTASGQAEAWLRGQPWVASVDMFVTTGPVPLPGSTYLRPKVVAKPGTRLADLQAFRPAVERYDDDHVGVTGLSVSVQFDDNALVISGDPAVNDSTFGLYGEAQGATPAVGVQVTGEPDALRLTVRTAHGEVMPAAEKLAAAPALPREGDLRIQVEDAQGSSVTTARGQLALLRGHAELIAAAAPVRSFVSDAPGGGTPSLTVVLDDRARLLPTYVALRQGNPPDKLTLQVQAGKLAVGGPAVPLTAGDIDRVAALSEAPGVSRVLIGDGTVRVVAVSPPDVARAASSIGTQAAAIGEQVTLGYGALAEVLVSGTPEQVVHTGALASPVLAVDAQAEVHAKGTEVAISMTRADQDLTQLFKSLRATKWSGPLRFVYRLGAVELSFTSTASGKAQSVEIPSNPVVRAGAPQEVVAAWDQTAP